MKKIGWLLCLLMLFCLPVYAAETTEYTVETLEESGATDLWNDLSPETRELYRAIGIDDLTALGKGSLSPEDFAQALRPLFAEQGRVPLALAGVLLATIVLCAYFSGLRQTVRDEGMGTVYSSISILAIAAAVLLPFMDCMRAVRDALSGASVFMGSFSPVYIAVLAAGGQLRAAASYQTVLLLFSQVLTWLTGGVLLPILAAAAAMGLVTAVSDTGNLGKLGDMLLRAVSWLLGILAAVFTMLLSMNSMLGAAGETLGNKMLRFSISSFVPVVGNAVSEAYLTVKSCIGLAKTTIGAFGMLTTVLLLAPAFLRCLCWQLCFWVCSVAAEAFGQTAILRLLKTFMGITKTMLAALLVCGVFMVIATTVVTLAGRGTV